MKILFDIGHPGHVHLFKNVISNLEAKGYQLAVTSRDKDVTTILLNHYGFKHQVLTKAGKGFFRLFGEMLRRDYKIYRLARKFKPDILVGGVGNVSVPLVGKIIMKPSIIFDDTEHAKYEHVIIDRLASVICTPACYKTDLGKKQVRYNGYHELAYLHPNYFKPDPSVLGELGLTESDRFIIVRFVAWQATHDIGQHGFDLHAKRKLVEELGKYARVLITSESALSQEFEKYRIATSPEKILDLLFYATMYIGEGATMASECAVSGTPAIYVNTLRLGYLDEEEERYGLVYNFSNPKLSQKQVLEKALELLRRGNLKEEWRARTKRLLSDKIDVTKFMVDFIENYPKSFHRYKERMQS